MAINIHTDAQFEKRLQWLSKKSGKTKTEIIKELVLEKYQTAKSGLRFGSLKGFIQMTPDELQKELKAMDEGYDLD